MNKSSLFVYTDGGSRGNPGPAAIGVFILDEEENVVLEYGQKIGIGTNNEAEYQAFLYSLEWVINNFSQKNTVCVTWHLDSNLVVQQINKQWKVKDQRMKKYAAEAWKLLENAPFSWKVLHIPREKNTKADALLNNALDTP